PEHKEQAWLHAPCGMLGLETVLAVTLTELVHTGVLTLPQAIEKLSTGPARTRDIAGHGGPIAPGQPANLALFDPEARWRVDAAALASRSRNNPFDGAELRGRVLHTVLRGRFTTRDGETVEAAEAVGVRA
ncbi:MAG: dihydroorotase, partial [Actinomycetota bacterium]